MLVLVLGITVTTQAQKKNKGNKESLTVEQRVEKLTEELGLSAEQVSQITPIIEEKAKRKASKVKGEKPSEEEREAMKVEKKAQKAAYKAKMQEILNEEQFEKFEAMSKKKGKKGKKRKKATEE